MSQARWQDDWDRLDNTDKRTAMEIERELFADRQSRDGSKLLTLAELRHLAVLVVAVGALVATRRSSRSNEDR
jgi:hypothetical protein